ncbi:unnamed protein product [Linum trigynum]|uniref:Cystatin domain-containing protein n=1 Tax=Linum trigynum TaxID=586398 RepID=A0AAV2EK52_9ROSI
MRALAILLTILFATVFLSASSLKLPQPPPVPSEWKPIKDLKAADVAAVAEAAVKQFNDKLPAGSKEQLKLESVENGDVKVFDDGKSVYRFHLKTDTNGGVGPGKVQLYEVVVGVADDKSGEKMKQLLAFLPVLN